MDCGCPGAKGEQGGSAAWEMIVIMGWMAFPGVPMARHGCPATSDPDDALAGPTRARPGPELV